MFVFPFLLDDPPAIDPGQGGSPPADSDDEPKDKETPPPADDKGQGDEETKQKAKSYDELFPKFTNLSKERGRLAEQAKDMGYDPETELETFVSDLVEDSRARHTPPDDDEPPDGDKPPAGEGKPDKETQKALGVAANLSIRANKKAEYFEFKESNPDFDPELKPELDKTIDQIIKQTPQMLQTGNWYATALRWKSAASPDFVDKIGKAAIKREEKRKADLNDLEDVGGGGVKAGGSGKTLKKTLEARFGA